jgi:tyrosine-protein phosphatase SIW14
MRLCRVLPVLAAFGFSGIAGVCADIPRQEKALPRFHEVAPGLYRGGQPKREGFDLLKQRGVKTIINLREERDERELVEGLGLKYVYIPLDARDQVSTDDITTFLATVSDPAHQPVFVHCRRGADRTGFMIGLYRIARQGWTAEQAYDEARAIGMRWWYRGLKRQLYEFAAKRADPTPSTAGR